MCVHVCVCACVHVHTRTLDTLHTHTHTHTRGAGAHLEGTGAAAALGACESALHALRVTLMLTCICLACAQQDSGTLIPAVLVVVAHHLASRLPGSPSSPHKLVSAVGEVRDEDTVGR